MSGFDISLFRNLAFGRPTPPDHPLKDESAVQKMIADLPADPLAGLAELTHWAVSVNTNDSFITEQRARVLLALDAASRPYWSELAMQYLAPDGHPAEGHDGDAAILRAMLDSATELAAGYGFSIEPQGRVSPWIEKNLAHLALRRARWLARRFALANMLHLPNIDAVWEDVHLLYIFAETHQVLRKAIHIYPGKAPTSSVKQEYSRLLLVDLAGPEALLARDIELVFRIAGRIAANARLETELIPGAICAIEPRGSSRPIAVRRLPDPGRSALYLDAFNCLPRLKAMLERNMDTEGSDPDTMFGPGYTLRERNAMINRLIDVWGPTPPQRRSKRVPLNTFALLQAGFENSIGVIQPLDQGNWKEQENAAPRLQIVLDNEARTKKADELKKSMPDTRVQLVDVSIAGLGLLVPRKDAPWASLGMLLAIYVEPGPDWIIGVLRRIGAEGKSLRLGVALISRKPKLAWFHLETTGYASVWEDAKRHERNFLEHFQRGILVDIDSAPLVPGEMLLAPDVASRGSRLDVPLAQGIQRIRVTAVRETTGIFHRVAFDSMGVTAYGSNGK